MPEISEETSEDASGKALAQNVKTIIIVEDDENVRQSMALMLRTRGYTVDTYRTGTELLSSPSSKNADCYLIDFKLPRIDGIQLLNKLRSAGVAAPALMITGFFSSTLYQRAKLAGYVDILEKPAIGDKLLEKISGFIL